MGSINMSENPEMLQSISEAFEFPALSQGLDTATTGKVSLTVGDVEISGRAG